MLCTMKSCYSKHQQIDESVHGSQWLDALSEVSASSGLPLCFRRPSSVTNTVWLVHLVTIVILLVDSDSDCVLPVGADSSSRSLFSF